mmetsp:Transcript_2000/g.3064  ORF Transcript_2000/g.3064 Transcript_2000/m.3064 type:complete len:115 (-) Transcript_2000:193-537(-)|eukprot:CAMPEP_0194213380 /NCGR_PEP_ID=MMETSP0156-20130528/13901_1 /TAXON_ID=33649 /ORGANISM="Thalassionema nitzschioides, Strain L26-B" /LENGTH=114 /DNA_ID=CAMNT_0038941387 /DNA_START=60 /DNA_END=404 /DNA_ORIENTATION=-
MSSALHEISSETELHYFLLANSSIAIVTFSAHWCGPCQRSKPQLIQLADKSSSIPFAYIPEADQGDFSDEHSIKSFPTYICFKDSVEVERVTGVDLEAVERMVKTHAPSTSVNE